MKLKELVDVINRFDNKIEVRTGNEWYYDIVEEIPLIHKASEDTYDSKYADWNVDSLDALDLMHIRVYITQD